MPVCLTLSCPSLFLQALWRLKKGLWIYKGRKSWTADTQKPVRPSAHIHPCSTAIPIDYIHKQGPSLLFPPFSWWKLFLHQVPRGRCSQKGYGNIIPKDSMALTSKIKLQEHKLLKKHRLWIQTLQYQRVWGKFFFSFRLSYTTMQKEVSLMVTCLS